MFGRRRNDEAVRLREALLAAASAAERAAAAADLAQEAAAQVVAELEKRTDDEGNLGRRLIVLSLACTGLIVLAGVIITFATEAFNDPQAFSTASGSIQVAIQAQRGSSSTSLPFPRNVTAVAGIAGEFGLDDTDVSYQIVLPSYFAGKKFAVLLQDDAVLTDVSGSIPLDAGKVRSCAERFGTGKDTLSFPNRCQVIYGTIPSGITGSLAPCNVDAEGLFGNSILASSITIEIDGSAGTSASLDWVHTIVTLPGIAGDATFDSTLHYWDGVNLGNWYGIPALESCKVLELFMPVSDANPTPSQRSDTQLVWTGEAGALDADIVFTASDAQSLGNGFLAVGGAIAALAIGLIPVTYGEWRSWSRKNRSARAKARGT